MAPVWDSVNKLVSENPRDVFIEASELLLKFASNILSKPNESRYRKIRLANPIVQSKLLPVAGALECLFEMGFLEDGEYLTMPVGSGLNTLRLICNDLQSEQRKLGTPASPELKSSQASSASASTTSPSAAGAPPASTTAAASSQQTTPIQNLRQLEFNFMSKVQTSMTHVMMYEDHTLQTKTREVIPLEELNKSADGKLRKATESNPARRGEAVSDQRDFLLLELLDWFKTSFFHWVDAPPCDSCGRETHLVGGVDAIPREKVWGASRVENYKCNNCHQFTRFPRYNHPQKLLETRRGRCGEWANCFTLCCRAVGFEARYVLDWTDHVWTEVYSQAQGRWLHCDPCENTCDKPLLYEAGWGKKLTYIIAFSKDEVLDVTWRYTAKPFEVQTRRQECRETWLCNVLFKLWNQKVDSYSSARKNELLQRLVVELVEFISPKSTNRQNLSGRTTGSVAWRSARGEMGDEAHTESDPFTFTLTREEKDRELVHVQYNCATDKYVRLSSSESEIQGFRNCVYKVSSIFRKEEPDWKKVYLAREEGTARASISWKFDFADSGLRIGRCYIRAESSVFESGQVMWTVCGDSTCIRLRGPDLCNLKEIEIKGSRSLMITAELSGGNGDPAWQHTQLFRQDLNSEYTPLEVKIHLV